MREALLERQMQRKFDEANQIAAPPAAMAKEDVLAGVDVKRGMRFPVQGAQSHKLRLQRRCPRVVGSAQVERVAANYETGQQAYSTPGRFIMRVRTGHRGLARKLAAMGLHKAKNREWP
jgi:hypothetical protein